MAKKPVTKVLKLQIKAGAANPGPPIGSQLGPFGINLPQFCKEYNEQTAKDSGSIVPVEITIYQDRTYSFKLGMPPMSDLIKKAIKIEKGAHAPGTEEVATISLKQVKDIAERKLPELNANDVEAAMKIVEGSARSMGIKVII
ncbi:MAG TPA: 50S ribosomal protein L11 [bacterium]|jgi:large subunit ribosomal protein L11